MNYEEAKQRSDYKFSVNIPEYLLAELKADWLNSFCENGDPERGAAVLEIGYVDIELNIFAENQVARMSDSENHRPVLNYFCCIKHGDKDDITTALDVSRAVWDIGTGFEKISQRYSKVGRSWKG